VRKNAELTVTGPYAHTRNPLYLGSTLIAFGFAAAAGSWVVLAALLALFAAIYVPTIHAEEEYLREHFAGFDSYTRAVPRLFPRLTAARPELPASGSKRAEFSLELYRKHREYNSLIGAGAIYLLLVLRLFYEGRMFNAGFSRPPWWH
jgi:hypothetical protein